MLHVRNYILSVILLWSVNLCYAQNNDSIIADVKAKCLNIHNNRPSYDTTMISVWGESTEGGEAVAYYKDSLLMFMEFTFFGEIGKTEMSYYYDNGQLLFVLERHFTYNRPIYWDSLRMKESNDTVVFDPSKTIVKNDEYYFHQGKLIRWFDHDGNDVDLTLGTNTLVGKGLIAHASKMRDLFMK